MTIKRLIDLAVLCGILTACGDNEPKMPSTAVDNSGSGNFNPRNCLVNEEKCRIQYFEDINLNPGMAVEMEFDSKGCLIKWGDGTSWEYPDESTVVMHTGYERHVFSIGKNGFADKCVAYDSEGDDYVYHFGYDDYGSLVSVTNDGGDQIIMEYGGHNLIHAKFINNCGEVAEECTFTYSDVYNTGFWYMPYGFSSVFEEEPFYFGVAYQPIGKAFLAGLLGKPNTMLPDTAVQTNNYGTKTTYYFFNQYLNDPQYIGLYRTVMHAYGWKKSNESPFGDTRIEIPVKHSITFE